MGELSNLASLLHFVNMEWGGVVVRLRGWVLEWDDCCFESVLCSLILRDFSRLIDNWLLCWPRFIYVYCRYYLPLQLVSKVHKSCMEWNSLDVCRVLLGDIHLVIYINAIKIVFVTIAWSVVTIKSHELKYMIVPVSVSVRARWSIICALNCCSFDVVIRSSH